MSWADRVALRFYGSSPRAAPYTGYRTRGFSLAETFTEMSVFPKGEGMAWIGKGSERFDRFLLQ